MSFNSWLKSVLFSDLMTWKICNRDAYIMLTKERIVLLTTHVHSHKYKDIVST